MKLYEKIKCLAFSRKVSVYRIERDLGLTNGTVSKWDKSTPSAENLHKVAKYLGTTVEALLEKEH